MNIELKGNIPGIYHVIYAVAVILFIFTTN